MIYALKDLIGGESNNLGAMISVLYRLTIGHAQKLRAKGTGQDLEIRNAFLVETSRLNLWDIIYLIGLL